MQRLNKIAADTYLALLVAGNHPDQAPAHKAAKWYDLLWLLIPIMGFMFFLVMIEARHGRCR